MMPDKKRRFGDIEIVFDRTCDDVASAALTMLAFGISKVPPDEREARLTDIEQTVRKAAKGFELRQQSPYPRVTNGYAAH